MQWQRAKSVMIIVFLMINIFLGSYLFAERYSGGTRNLENLTAILAKNQIHLRIDTLPRFPDTIFVPEFSAPVLKEKVVAALVPSPIAEEDGYVSEDGTCRLELRGTQLSYENTASQDPRFKKVTEKNVISKLEPQLKVLGIETLVYPVDIFELDGEISVKYAYRVEDQKLFDSYLYITVTADGIRRINGFLGIPDTKHGFSYTLSQMETVLISLAQTDFGNMEISDIELGYYFINYSDAFVSQAIPVYQVRTSLGTVLLDARDGVPKEERILSDPVNGGLQ